MNAIKRYKPSVLDVQDNRKYFIAMLFNKISNLFTFNNLPETVDEQYLKYQLFMCGRALWFYKNGSVYVGRYAPGGEPNEYYIPKLAVYANPVLGSQDFITDVNAVPMFLSTADKLSIMSDNPHFYGVCPTRELILKTAELLADCISSINICQKNARASVVITAPTQAVKNSIDLVLDRIYSGEPAVAAIDGAAIDNAHTLPLVTTEGAHMLQELRETYQFYLAQFYHNIGCPANSNMKRERLTDDETETENAQVLINISDMLDTLTKECDKINAKFDLNISVELSEYWENATGGDEVNVLPDDTTDGAENSDT